jgi:uncharacterized protein YjiS (DUF1127 family)
MTLFVPNLSTSSTPMGAATILRVVNSVERVIDGLMAAVKLAETRRRTRAQLGRLTARQLADIGLEGQNLDDAIERRIG